MSTDLLVLAGLASEILERHGFIACGRRENGVARVDFWDRHTGRPYRHELNAGPASATVDEVVAACLALAEREVEPTPPPRISHLS
jgi:hypothetical protein